MKTLQLRKAALATKTTYLRTKSRRKDQFAAKSKMLREVSLAVLFAVCYGYVFENGHTRVALLNPKSVDSVERFAQVAAQRKSSQWRNRAQGILRSLKNPFLLRGTPMNSFHPQQLLPLTVRKNTFWCFVVCFTKIYESRSVDVFPFQIKTSTSSRLTQGCTSDSTCVVLA